MRAAILAIGALFLAGGAIAAFLGATPIALELAGFGVLILIGTALERRFYRIPGGPPPGPDWQPTNERFRDPTSGHVVAVWFNPRTGQRSYSRAVPPA